MADPWDIVIVGAGTTGIPAAIKASERGAKVLVVDVADKVGGTLHMSSGSMSAAGSKLQKSKGIDDSPQKHFDESIDINHGTGEYDKMRLWQDNSGETLDWLMSIGLEFPESNPVIGQGHEPYKTARLTTPVNAGRAYIAVLEPAFQNVIDNGNVELRLKTKMTDLIVDADGSVGGIVVQTENGDREEIRASTTLLACGGYANNDELWKEFHGRPKRVYTYEHSKGDGIQQARKLGAQVQLADNLIMTFGGTIDIDNPDDYWIHTATVPMMRAPWEIMVNNTGRRFFNEESTSQDFRERTIMNQPDWSCWVIYDQGIREQAPPLFMKWDAEKIERAFSTHPDFCRADTIEGLAKECGLPADNLKTTVEQFNKGRAVNSDAWRRQHTPAPIEKAPFYAIRHYALSVVSFGGIACDNELRILDEKGRPIPNLYAGGEMLGMGIWGNAYLGGSSVGGCLTMGRLLGEKFLSWETAAAAAAE
ncbi:MAG: FAD-dependent oxidoreductase [Rhodospirillaceae bacterium]